MVIVKKQLRGDISDAEAIFKRDRAIAQLERTLDSKWEDFVEDGLQEVHQAEKARKLQALEGARAGVVCKNG